MTLRITPLHMEGFKWIVDCHVRFAYFANAKCTGRNDIVD